MSRLTKEREDEMRPVRIAGSERALSGKEAIAVWGELDAVRAERNALLKAARHARECRYIAQCQECPKRLDKAIAKVKP